MPNLNSIPKKEYVPPPAKPFIKTKEFTITTLRAGNHITAFEVLIIKSSFVKVFKVDRTTWNITKAFTEMEKFIANLK